MVKQFLILFLFLPGLAWSQILIEFDSLPFPQVNNWQGDTTNFKISNETLMLNAPHETGSSGIFFHSEYINNAQWMVRVMFDFNPSSNNYALIYLAGNGFPDTLGFKGYYLKIGSSDDDIKFYFSDGNTSQLLIDGPDDVLNSSSVLVDIKVKRDSTGFWQLYSKLDSDEEFILLGSTIDQSNDHSSYFAIECHYTSTRSNKFSFDNISIDGESYRDYISPSIDSSYFKSGDSLVIIFNEPVQIPSNFNGIWLDKIDNPATITYVTDDPPSLLIHFSRSLVNGIEYLINITGVSDSAGNMINNSTLLIRYFQQGELHFKGIVINELLIDPTPPEDLPEHEFIELLNVSNQPIQLKGWMLSDQKSVAVLEDCIILPDSMIVITASSILNTFSDYKNVVGISPWPSLNNSSDSISLLTVDSIVIDYITYSTSSLPENPNDGGTTIELINPYLSCNIPSNWAWSIADTGGSPGTINSQYSLERNKKPIEIHQITLLSDHLLLLSFSEQLMRSDLNNANYTLNEIQLVPNLSDETINNEIILESSILFQTQSYELRITGLSDCDGDTLNVSSFILAFDLDPPKIDSIRSKFHDEFTIYFNEWVNANNLGKEDFMIGNIGNPSLIKFNHENSQIKLQFDTLLFNEFTSTLYISNLEDSAGNLRPQVEVQFRYIPPPIASTYDLVITEIMANPDPDVTKIETEYIEIYNPSSISIPLRGYILSDKKNRSTLTEGVIAPESYIVIAPHNKVNTIPNSKDLNIVGVSNWPGFNKSDDEVFLLNNKNEIIHTVFYNEKWYQNQLKQNGGWSMEMIDTTNPCSEENNWTASISSSGGTPGFVNSVSATKNDLTGPGISGAWVISKDTVLIRFNEKMDSSSLKNTNFKFSPELVVSNVKADKYGKEFYLVLSTPMYPSVKYTLQLKGSLDCNGNQIISGKNQMELVLPESVIGNDLIINEILFNPITEGTDFIELYNTSSKYLDLHGLIISNGKDSAIIDENIFLPPNDFIVFVASEIHLYNSFPTVPSDKLHQLRLPSWNDDAGTAIIINTSNLIVDKMDYNNDMHLELLYDTEGVSLERVSTSEPAEWPSNWKSATETAGYATPGRINSQYRLLESTLGTITVSPRVFDPLSSSAESFTTISFQFEKPGYIGSLQIFNLEGKLVKQLLNNASLTQKGFITWEGTNTNEKKVPVGYYIILFEIFDLTGTVKRFKKKVVVGTQF